MYKDASFGNEQFISCGFSVMTPPLNQKTSSLNSPVLTNHLAYFSCLIKIRFTRNGLIPLNSINNQQPKKIINLPRPKYDSYSYYGLIFLTKY